MQSDELLNYGFASSTVYPPEKQYNFLTDEAFGSFLHLHYPEVEDMVTSVRAGKVSLKHFDGGIAAISVFPSMTLWLNSNKITAMWEKCGLLNMADFYETLCCLLLHEKSHYSLRHFRMPFPAYDNRLMNIAQDMVIDSRIHRKNPQWRNWQELIDQINCKIDETHSSFPKISTDPKDRHYILNLSDLDIYSYLSALKIQDPQIPPRFDEHNWGDMSDADGSQPSPEGNKQGGEGGAGMNVPPPPSDPDGFPDSDENGQTGQDGQGQNSHDGQAQKSPDGQNGSPDPNGSQSGDGQGPESHDGQGQNSPDGKGQPNPDNPQGQNSSDQADQDGQNLPNGQEGKSSANEQDGQGENSAEKKGQSSSDGQTSFADQDRQNSSEDPNSAHNPDVKAQKTADGQHSQNGQTEPNGPAQENSPEPNGPRKNSQDGQNGQTESNGQEQSSSPAQKGHSTEDKDGEKRLPEGFDDLMDEWCAKSRARLSQNDERFLPEGARIMDEMMHVIACGKEHNLFNLLQKFIKKISYKQTRYTWKKISKKQPYCKPGVMYKKTPGEVLLMIDTSGSMHEFINEHIAEMANAVYTAFARMSRVYGVPSRMYKADVDNTVLTFKKIEKVEELKEIDLAGGGGNDFEHIFDELVLHWKERTRSSQKFPDFILVLTDFGDDWKFLERPEYKEVAEKIIWLSTDPYYQLRPSKGYIVNVLSPDWSVSIR